MNSRAQYVGGALAVRIFLCFASAYLLSYAFRSINAVIAPVLLADLQLSNADLGLLSAAYFLTFAAMQLPLGVWLDRYGPRKTEAALLLFAAAGASLFALGTTLTTLWLGRALIGVGVSACLMASFKAFRIWYPPERQSQLASWMLVAGTSGALASTLPVTAALPAIGWRGVFWIMAGMILLSAAAIYFLLGKVEARYPLPRAAPTPQSAPNREGYRRVFGDPYFRRLALLGLVNQGSFLALQTLWAGPWMVTVLGMSREQASQILFLFNFCLLAAYLALGWAAPRYVSHRSNTGWPLAKVVSLGLAGTLLAQSAILIASASWAWVFWLVLAGFATVTTLVQAEVNLSFPAGLAGRANSAYNLLLFIGAFTVQWGMGLLIDAFGALGMEPANAMRAAFAIGIVLQTLALLAFMANRTAGTAPD